MGMVTEMVRQKHVHVRYMHVYVRVYVYIMHVSAMRNMRTK